MKTHYSNPQYAAPMLQLHEQRMKLYPPAIPFARQSQAKKKKKKKDDGDDESDEDDSKTKTLKLRLDPTKVKSPKHEYKMKVFSDGTPEEWLKFLIDFEETVCYQHPLQTFNQKLMVLRTLLDGQMKERFDAAIKAVPQVQQVDKEGNMQMVQADHEVLYRAAIDSINEVLFSLYGGTKQWRKRSGLG